MWQADNFRKTRIPRRKTFVLERDTAEKATEKAGEGHYETREKEKENLREKSTRQSLPLSCLLDNGR